MKFLYLISLLPNILILFFFKKIVNIINIFDEPDQIRKIHSKKVPIIGGIVIFINILTLLILEFIFLSTKVILGLHYIQSDRSKLVGVNGRKKAGFT